MRRQAIQQKCLYRFDSMIYFLFQNFHHGVIIFVRVVIPGRRAGAPRVLTASSASRGPRQAFGRVENVAVVLTPAQGPGGGGSGGGGDPPPTHCGAVIGSRSPPPTLLPSPRRPSPPLPSPPPGNPPHPAHRPARRLRRHRVAPGAPPLDREPVFNVSDSLSWC